MSSIEDIKQIMDAFDPAALLPDLSTVIGKVAFITRIAVLVGPIVLMVMGLLYFFAAPKEANYRFGYRCYYGMGGVEAWRFTQRLAGAVWSVLGILLTIIALLLSAGFGKGEIMDVIGSGFTCLIWEVVLTAVSCLAVNVIVTLRFDAKGDRRRGKSE